MTNQTNKTMKTTTKTDNKLIAEFMGYVVMKETEGKCFRHKDHPFDVSHLDDFKYNTSWDWLIPVVEKIEKLGYRVLIVTDEVDVESNAENPIQKSLGTYCPDGTKKGATYKAVIEFIKWYNLNK